MEAWSLDELRTARESESRLYHEFLRVPTMSAGYYRLPAGATDPQSPHLEDEIYVVVGGHAWITVGDEEREIGPADSVFVAATVPHRFHDIVEDLELIVFFAPPETR
ncbi:MAG: cupin domain-containing protein [Candidatus Limnocylindrales bacterium]